MDSSLIVLFIAALATGASIGSFLNVVIHRLPLMMFKEWVEQCDEIKNDPTMDQLPADRISLAGPPSNCPSCHATIAPWHNIPILSFLLLGGKCNSCSARINPRYFFVELGCALLCIFIVLQDGLSYHTAFALGYTFLLVPLIFIDIQHKLLPDNITYLTLWLGVIYAIVGADVTLESSIIGVMAGYLSLWSVYIAFKLITGKEGMGYGDFKLLAAIGAWVGWQQLLHVVLLSSVFGTLFYVLVLVVKKEKIGMLPFGPFLALAGWITFYWGGELTRLYLATI